MYWQKIAKNRLQKVMPFRVFPLPENIKKRAAVPTKDHLKYGFFMENYTELHKNDSKNPSKDAK